MNKRYTLTLPLELYERLNQTAKFSKKKKAEILRNALENYLDEIEDFAPAIEALEDLKVGDSKKLDNIIKKLKC
ncbi:MULTISPECIES: ribbon-helix-helix protein, CopG family [Campylobacter]|uniref:CopG family transcriptional regulator n=1 Tax=Campylobacter lari TaxID=201 RepID=A0A7U7W7E8_CAMLA|nr:MULTISPECIES: ribbon-helix-helix protein, CopG family [Campylobacter]EAI3906234.1 CopG family transcriptional regulator [Campylobacter lari]EAI3914869.1 CopG family transcriptional regulator [Campylobacter lari]EAI4448610.1 CopG family transcriptional regulator [Campylobacter lari]EAI8625095.1 CopG family transcriptional regulator [Campylobacter lari]EAK0812244.1 CopG family transcriptional regulator [Campylobacter lari]